MVVETGPVDGPWDLPGGWRWEPLGRYSADRSESINPARWPDKLFELYSVPSFDSRRPEVIAGKEIGSSKQTVQPGDVLLCKINPRINRAWIVGLSTSNEQIASTEWIRFPRAPDLVPEFLRHYFSMEALRSYLAMNASGVGGSLMRVKAATLANYPVPVPPLDTQRRIVARIDELFSELDDGQAALARARADLETYRKSLLKAAVTGELTADWRAANPPAETGEQLLQRILADRKARWEADPKNKGKQYKQPEAPDTSSLAELPHGWKWANVGQLAIVDSGATPKGCEATAQPQGVIPWFKVSSMSLPGNETELKHSAWWHSADQVASLGLRVFPAGSIVFPKLGGALLTNKRRILAQDSTLDLNNMAVSVIEPVSKYLWYIFSGIDMAGLSDGSVVPQLKRDAVESIIVALPPREELDELVRVIETSFVAADDMLSEISRDLGAAANLRQAILAAAFRGELVQ